MDPKLTNPLQARNDHLMMGGNTANNHARTDRDRLQERQRVTKDWRDLAELLQHSSGEV